MYQQYQMRVINGVQEVIPEEPFDLLLSSFSRVERHLPKGMVFAYAAPSPLALIPLLGPAAIEIAQFLNIAPLEDGAAKAAPLTESDLEHAAPDFKVKARNRDVEDAVSPVTSQREPAAPPGAGPMPASARRGGATGRLEGLGTPLAHSR